MDFLARSTGPWLHIAELDQSPLTNCVLRLMQEDRDLAVRVVRGRKMITQQALFDEFAAAYQFPFYFGENWNAFHDCINDLAWLPAARHLTVIMGAEAVLSASRERFRALVETLDRAGREWSESSAATRPWAPQPRPFHVILQAESGDGSELRNALSEAKVAHDSRTWP